MSYIKQNWTEMQEHEIPVEAKHLEHIEESLADVIDKVGKVATEEIVTWHDSVFECDANNKVLISSVNKLSLQENKAYKVILTDLEGTEAAYELSLIDSEQLGTTAGYKILYYGDLHLGGDTGFVLIQDGIGILDDRTITETPGKTGITLTGYRKAIVKKAYSSTEIKKSIVQNEEYAKVSQTDFDCEDENNIAFLKNKPFGKSHKKVNFVDLPLATPSDLSNPWVNSPKVLNIDASKSYVLHAINTENEEIYLASLLLKCTTVREFFSPETLKDIPKDLYNCLVLHSEDFEDLPLICCGFTPTTFSTINGISYFVPSDYISDYNFYRLESSGESDFEIEIFNKLPAIYQESPDFEETDKDSGTYIKNLPLGVSFLNDTLFEANSISVNKNGYVQDSYMANFSPTLNKAYKITINDQQYSAVCSTTIFRITSHYSLKCYCLTCPLAVFYIFDKDFLVESGFFTNDDAAAASGTLMIQLSSNFKNTTVSIKIQGPKATYKKLENKYLPSLLVSPDSKNDLRIDYIAGDYYFSTPDNPANGAIAEALDFSNFSLENNSIIDTSFNEEELNIDIVHISNELLTCEDQDYFFGKYLIASEPPFDGDYGYFEYCAPIITAIDDGYLYVLPSVPKVFKLDSLGIKTFYDLSKYESTWKEFFSNLSRFKTVKILHGVYQSSYNWYDCIEIIGILESNTKKGYKLTITGLDDEKSAFCTFDNDYDCVETVSSLSAGPNLAAGQFTGKLFIRYDGHYVNSLVNSTDYLAYELYNNAKPYKLFPEGATGVNLCTVIEAGAEYYNEENYCYRYLDDKGIEHWRTGIINNNTPDYSGISNIKHTNYISLKGSKLPFKEFDTTGIYPEFLTYTEEGNLIKRNAKGEILATYPVKGQKIRIGNESLSQWHLIVGKNCLFLINNMLREYQNHQRWQTNVHRIDKADNEFIITSIDIGPEKLNPSMSLMYSEQYLIAAPKVLGNYLFLPAVFGRDNSTQAKYLIYMPLYKTEADMIKSLNKQLSELKERIAIPEDTLFIFDGGDADY